MRNPKARGTHYTGLLQLGAEPAVSQVWFYLNAGEEQYIDFPVTLPTAAGNYPVSVSVFAGEKELAMFPAANVYVTVQVPAGAIVMWSGPLASIPAGWVLCDGAHGTPDLRERFIMGAPAGLNPGITGGSVSKYTDGHRHTAPAHSHSIEIPPLPIQVSHGTYYRRPGQNGTFQTTEQSQGYTGYENDLITDIRPPYFALAFIMKL